MVHLENSGQFRPTVQVSGDGQVIPGMQPDMCGASTDWPEAIDAAKTSVTTASHFIICESPWSFALLAYTREEREALRNRRYWPQPNIDTKSLTRKFLFF